LRSATRASLAHKAAGSEIRLTNIFNDIPINVGSILSYHLITEVLAFTKSILSASGRVYGEAMSAGPDWPLGRPAQGHAQSSIKIDQSHKTLFPMIPKDLGESFALISTIQKPCQIVHEPRH
jgi:hypothetical protein